LNIRLNNALDISTAARLAAVSPPVLRAWEARFGFPRPARSPGGRRLYSPAEVEAIQRVVRDRAAGLSLEAAIARALGGEAPPGGSIFAGLRRRRPQLEAHRLDKATLIRLSRAIEDEYCARADRALLFAGFQRERFYRQAEERWRSLAERADLTVVFADFKRRRTRRSAPLELRVERDHPLSREWAVVCDGPRYSACLTAWELPGEEGRDDLRRRFEVIWSIEPEVVRDAALAAVEIAAQSLPSIESLLPARLREPAPPSGDDLQTAIALTNRMLAYVSSR
jgi:MerR family transcriptional regulator, light-induced transcriptional regulator